MLQPLLLPFVWKGETCSGSLNLVGYCATAELAKMSERINERPFQKDKIKNKCAEEEEQEGREDNSSDESNDEDEGSRLYGVKPDDKSAPQ